MSPLVPEAPDYREGPRLPQGLHPLISEEDDAGEPAAAYSAEAAERRSALVAAKQHGLRIDKLLVTLAPEFSRNHMQTLLEQGHVWLQGQLAKTASKRVQVGQTVEVELVPTAESRAYTPQALALDVVFEDEHLLVLNKPAGLVVHPAPGNWSGTLLNGLLARHAGAAALPRAGIVHRLDKDTSGLMLVGKSLQAVTALSKAIAAREVKRRYLALAHGQPLQTSFSVEAPIGRDPRVRVRMAVVGVHAGGRVSRTDVECLAYSQGVAALSCRLHTGRTHQIRVHLASVGHPLVADSLYGGRPALGLERQALHATELGLLHPTDGRPLQFSQAPPADFSAAWSAIAGGD